jgi:hypothetical protein
MPAARQPYRVVDVAAEICLGYYAAGADAIHAAACEPAACRVDYFDLRRMAWRPVCGVLGGPAAVRAVGGAATRRANTMGDAADYLTESMLEAKALHDSGQCGVSGPCEWCDREQDDADDVDTPLYHGGDAEHGGESGHGGEGS